MYLCVVCVSSLVMISLYVFVISCLYLTPSPIFKFFFWVFLSKFIVMRQQNLICIPLKIDMWTSNVLYVMKQPVWVPVLVQYRLKWLSLYIICYTYKESPRGAASGMSRCHFFGWLLMSLLSFYHVQSGWNFNMLESDLAGVHWPEELTIYGPGPDLWPLKFWP